MIRAVVLVALCCLATNIRADENPPTNSGRNDFYTDSGNVWQLPFQIVRRLAYEGAAEAQYELASRFANGEDTMASDLRAYIWFQIAASQGYPEAAEAGDRFGRYLAPRQLARAHRRIDRLLSERQQRQLNDRRHQHTVGRPLAGPVVLQPANESTVVGDIGVDADSVHLIQRALVRLGYRPGPTDGVAGPRTASAITQYQRDHELIANGRPSVRLMDHLAARLQTQLDADKQRYSALGER